MSKVSFMTFASSDWVNSPKRFKEDLENINTRYGYFDRYFIWNEKDLDKEYQERFSKYYTDHGFAYFSWKPYSIRQALENIDYGDFLMYLDSGCVLPMDRIEGFLNDTSDTIRNMKNNDVDIGITTYIDRNPNIQIPNICVVKKEILQKFGLVDNQKFLFQFPHFQAGLFILRKTQDVINFLGRWYDFFDKNYESCIRGGYTDRTNQDQRYFIHNGSDQAVLQCMLFTENTRVLISNYFYDYDIIKHRMG